MLLLGADESLCSLLSEVLGDLGMELLPPEQSSRAPDVILTLVRREVSMLRLMQEARDGTYPAPVVVLLPFTDERLARQALKLGACGCYTLGTPLEGLRELLLELDCQSAARSSRSFACTFR